MLKGQENLYEVCIVLYLMNGWISQGVIEIRIVKILSGLLQYYSEFLFFFNEYPPVATATTEGNHCCLPFKQLDSKRNNRSSLIGSSMIALNESSLQA